MHFLVVLTAAVIPAAQASLPARAPQITPLSWSESQQRASDFVSQLTLDEKIGIVSGGYLSPSLPCVGSIGAISRLDFNGVCFSDGPAGVVRSDGVSAFPAGITIAATWDRDLMYRRAVAIGEEFRAKGAHVALGPSTGPMGRSARGGRNWEGFGPDPYLAGVATNASVLGIQSAGVQACTKHLIANEQETQRTSTTSDDGSVVEAISSNVDDRTLHEVYLWPFGDAVKAGTSTVMCSYNRVNGSYACANSNLLTKVLQNELAFPGYVVSDWYATHATESSANAGLDLEMPGNVSAAAGASYFGDALLEAINAGRVTEQRLDDMATRVMTPYYRLGQDQDFPTVDPASAPVFYALQYGHPSLLLSPYPEVEARDVRENHADVIREAGSAGTVLLKNVNGTLPLQKITNIGIFGNDAGDPVVGSAFLDINNHPEGYEFGTFAIGGGSGAVRYTDLISPLEAIRDYVKGYGGRVQTVLDNDLLAQGGFNTVYPTPDACLLFLKAYASEGTDRASIDLQFNATKAVESTAALCSNTIVVVHGPGIVLMPWADNENVTAILAAHYPGDQSGNSIVDVLWGAVEPSGRLPYTIPKKLSDYGPDIVESPDFEAPNGWQANFTEGQAIDYRHFDAAGITPQYEFGYGLGYTTFDVSAPLQVHINGNLSSVADKSKGTQPGGLVDLWSPVASASVEITNTGSRTGSAVTQLYVSFPQSTTPEGTPVQVLRGFSKEALDAGASKSIHFDLLRRDLSFWDSDREEWVIPGGTFTFSTGFSSRDLRTRAQAAVLS
ncbi:putative beta-glucosidase 2 protein [Rosellinia necatrix]|uniref:Beta-glucosidase cel3A n=1 Tax=Rosellinia necatrix TaxID=77044 RepID=A0A1W2TTC8_ROSNE|nr:putative beta-glucosidase 2 protein [Rosellinia necatrix]